MAQHDLVKNPHQYLTQIKENQLNRKFLARTDKKKKKIVPKPDQPYELDPIQLELILV